MKLFGPREPVTLFLRDAGFRNPPEKSGRQQPPQVSPPDRQAGFADLREGLPRRFGDFLLTSRLGEDGLGRVYRALCLAEGGEFVRLRIFHPRELAAEPLQRAVERYREANPGGPSPYRTRGERVGTVLDTAYLAWNETNGWTLDSLLADLHRHGRRLPIEHVLLIADGITKALESGGPHGLVWPGFVSISEDGEVRLGGFGLAEGILPSLETKELSETLPPYVAPEELEEKRVGKNADVYSLGVIVLELLTSFRTPFPGLGRGVGAEDLFPHELGRVLAVALSKPRSRFSDISDLRRELGQFVVSGGYFPSSFHFSRYLKDFVQRRDARLRAVAEGVESPPEIRAFGDLPHDMPSFPPLDEREIEAVLERFWARIQA